YKCALNLALQLHLSGWSSEQSDGTTITCPHDAESGSIPDLSEFDQIPVEGDYLSLDLPPVGLTRDLWMRIVECCRGLSPYIGPAESGWAFQKWNTPEQEKLNGDREYPVQPLTVNKVDRQPPDSNGERYFSRVHEFSVKEEHLRTHAHAIHDSEMQSSASPHSDTESVEMPDWFRGSDLNEVASQRANDDYLPGMWSEVTAPPFTWRPVRLEDGAVPMAGYNTNNSCPNESKCSSARSMLRNAEEVNGGTKSCTALRHGNSSVNGKDTDNDTDDTDYDHQDNEGSGDNDADDDDDDDGMVTDGWGDRGQDEANAASCELNGSSTTPAQLVPRVSILRIPSVNTGRRNFP
ncbi:hypothetical protein FGIG_11142, partial [Fasciola gigantica]